MLSKAHDLVLVALLTPNSNKLGLLPNRQVLKYSQFSTFVMAGNLLWAHLLRKDATTSESLSQIPPIAPQDKTGTSMRMLIHDTQVNLEKFSTRLDGLLQRVDDCRSQVVNANKLLDVERDKVLTEILEIGALACALGPWLLTPR